MIKKLLRKWFAMFEVRDTNGTKQYCWTMEEARQWLPYCSEYAAVFHRKTGQTICWRYTGKRLSRLKIRAI